MSIVVNAPPDPTLCVELVFDHVHTASRLLAALDHPPRLGHELVGWGVAGNEPHNLRVLGQ